MSLETLNVLDQQRKDQIELSPFSETFTVSGLDPFIGIFEEANFTGGKDSGNIKKSFLRPVIMVNIIPAGLVEQESIITRENGADNFTFYKAGKDKQGIPLLWLS